MFNATRRKPYGECRVYSTPVITRRTLCRMGGGCQRATCPGHGNFRGRRKSRVKHLFVVFVRRREVKTTVRSRRTRMIILRKHDRSPAILAAVGSRSTTHETVWTTPPPRPTNTAAGSPSARVPLRAPSRVPHRVGAFLPLTKS